MEEKSHFKLKRNIKWLLGLSLFMVAISFLLPWGNVYGYLSSGFWFRDEDRSEGSVFLWGLAVHETITREHWYGPSTETKDSFYSFPFDFQTASFALALLGLLLIFGGYYNRATPAVGGILVFSAIANFLNGLTSGNKTASTLFGYGSIQTEPSYGYVPAILGALIAIIFTLSYYLADIEKGNIARTSESSSPQP